MTREREIENLRAALSTMGDAPWEASRRDVILQRLEDLDLELHAPARVELTFQGAPVLGQEAIDVGFAAGALDGFTGLSAAFFKHTKVDGSLYVTGTARGSFGFVLEELRGQLMTAVARSPLVDATDSIARLIGGIDASPEAAAGLPPPVLKPLRRLLVHLTAADASMRVHTRDAEGGLSAESARAAVAWFDERAESTQSTAVLVGVLDGVLTHSTRFEFVPEKTTRVYKGGLREGLNTDLVASYFQQRCLATITTIVTEYPTGYTRTTHRLDWVTAADGSQNQPPS